MLFDSSTVRNINDAKENEVFFKIKKYMIFSILPKCTLGFGEIVSTVYFQIALNINQDLNAKFWKKQRCWISANTISKMTGYNVRSINRAIKILSDLQLIEVVYHGNLKMFKLLNHNLNSLETLNHFQVFFENKILEGNSKNKNELQNKFYQINKKLYQHNVELFLEMNLLSVNNMKELLNRAEYVYKGSSLFFIHLLEKEFCKKNDDEYHNIFTISEMDLSLLIGCSQSTLNRYVRAYQEAKIIYCNKRSAYESNGFQFQLTKEKQKNLFESRVNNIMNNENLICPLCEDRDDFISSRALSMHLSKTGDSNHQLLKELKIKPENRSKSLVEIYEENKESFKTSVKVKKQITDNYMSIPCDCKMSCNECFTSWKNDFFNGCNHIRKSAYIEENEIDINDEVKQKKQKKVVKELDGFENIPVSKKIPYEDTAPGLLKYFYDKVGGVSPNFGKESRLIKNLLVSKTKPLTPDEVRIVLNFMARKGQIDLRFINTSVNDALQEQKNLKEMEVEGTAAYLVKRFYEGHNLPINMLTFNREVQKIQETINSGLGYEKTMKVIDYMVTIKCTVINFIGSKITEALSNNQTPGGFVKTASKNFNNNPSFFDQDELVIIRDDLAGGRTHLKRVNEKNREKAIEAAKEIFNEGKYSSDFTSFEWAWRIGLPLDYNMYKKACSDLHKETHLDYIIKNSKDKVDQEKMSKLMNLKDKFHQWLEKQHSFFHQSKIE